MTPNTEASQQTQITLEAESATLLGLLPPEPTAVSSLSTGETVYGPGATGLYYVYSGGVQVYRDSTRKSREVRVHVGVYGAGQMFGPLAGPSVSEYAVAFSPAKIAHWSEKALAGLPIWSLRSALLRLALLRREDMIEYGSWLQYPIPDRLEFALEYLREKFGAVISPSLKHQALAWWIGTTRPGVSKELARFRREGRVDYDESTLRIPQG